MGNTAIDRVDKFLFRQDDDAYADTDSEFVHVGSSDSMDVDDDDDFNRVRALSAYKIEYIDLSDKLLFLAKRNISRLGKMINVYPDQEHYNYQKRYYVLLMEFLSDSAKEDEFKEAMKDYCDAVNSFLEDFSVHMMIHHFIFELLEEDKADFWRLLALKNVCGY